MVPSIPECLRQEAGWVRVPICMRIDAPKWAVGKREQVQSLKRIGLIAKR